MEKLSSSRKTLKTSVQWVDAARAVYYGENKNKLNDLIISVRPHVFVRFEKVIFLRIYNTVDEIYRLMNF